MITSLTRPVLNPLDLANLAADKDGSLIKDGSSPESVSYKLLNLIFKAGGEEGEKVLEQFCTVMNGPDHEEFKARLKKLQTDQPLRVVAHWVHGLSLVGWSLDTADQVLEQAKTKGNKEIESIERRQKWEKDMHFNGSGFLNPVSEEAVKALGDLNDLYVRRS